MATNTIQQSDVRATCALYFKEAAADKVYVPYLLARDGGFDVIASYGRRGGTLIETEKCKGVDEATARKAYDRLVTEKMAKGYRPAVDITYSNSQWSTQASLPPETPSVPAEGRQANVPVQLLNPIDASEAARLLRDDKYVVQEKKDGVRRLLVIRDGKVTGVNRRGLYVGVSRAIANEAKIFGSDAIVDGEQIGDDFFAFDLLRCEGRDLTGIPFENRFDVLEAAFVPGLNRVHLVAVVRGAKRESYITSLQDGGSEGAVIRDKTAKLQIGRPNSGGVIFKFKFWASATCIVTAQNEIDSVAIGLLDESGVTVNVGNVSTSKKPSVGTLVEIKYLYAHRGGCLVQPHLKGIRDDVAHTDCTLSQLSYKGEPAR